MENLETLIASMECCIREGDCQDCAYECGIDHSCISNLMHDALDVIRTKEPHCLTIEELKGYIGKPVWVEEKGCDPYCEVVFDVDGIAFGLTKGEVEFGSVITGHAMLSVSGYGSTSRAWTAPPTNEHRRLLEFADHDTAAYADCGVLMPAT